MNKKTFYILFICSLIILGIGFSKQLIINENSKKITEIKHIIVEPEVGLNNKKNEINNLSDESTNNNDIIIKNILRVNNTDIFIGNHFDISDSMKSYEAYDYINNRLDILSAYNGINVIDGYSGFLLTNNTIIDINQDILKLEVFDNDGNFRVYESILKSSVNYDLDEYGNIIIDSDYMINDDIPLNTLIGYYAYEGESITLAIFDIENKKITFFSGK